MARKILISLIVLISCSFATGAWADCVYQSKTYPTGTKIGGLTCQADASWR